MNALGNSNLKKRLWTIPSVFLMILLIFHQSGCSQQEVDDLGKRLSERRQTDILSDSFNSNSNAWLVTEDEFVSLSINAGQYVFRNKTVQDTRLSFIPVRIDQSRDFVIETTLTWLEGIKDNGFGLAWGLLDTNNHYRFTISADGHFNIINAYNGKLLSEKWVKSTAIKSGSQTNNLMIKKLGNQTEFYINGQVVERLPFDEFYGDNLGFVVSLNQAIKINSISVIQ